MAPEDLFFFLLSEVFVDKRDIEMACLLLLKLGRVHVGRIGNDGAAERGCWYYIKMLTRGYGDETFLEHKIPGSFHLLLIGL